MKTVKNKKKLKSKRKLKLKIRHFDESKYTVDRVQLDRFKSDLARKGINNSNYLFISINCPKRIEIKEGKKQFDYLDTILKNLTIFYVACFEWSDERSNGYHLHIIISEEDFDFNLFPDELFVDDSFYKSELQVDNSLDRCLGYMTKERKGCTAKNRKEKFYFSNIPERRLIPIGIRPIIKEDNLVEVIDEAKEQMIKETQNKQKKKLKVFYEELFIKVKTVISRLFIKNQEQYYYDYKKEIICQSTRDGPAKR
jgi:hypothetical protein